MLILLKADVDTSDVAESEDVDIHLLVGYNILQSSQKNESDPLFF